MILNMQLWRWLTSKIEPFISHREIEGLRKTEVLKQELISSFDWSSMEAFRLIDEFSHGNVNNDKYQTSYFNLDYSLRCFLRKFKFSSSIDESDITALIRIYDKDVDRVWSYREFASSVAPLLQIQLKAKDLHKV